MAKKVIVVDFDGALLKHRPFDMAHKEWFRVMAELLMDQSINEYAFKEDYYTHVLESCKTSTPLDPDTITGPGSWRAALSAAGAACAAVDFVYERQDDAAAFCAVRPPGHHAEPGRAMGFCLFNNAAIAAAYALEMTSARRVFIFDWDVHHGNGTQAAFYDNPDVFYCSIHQHPFYPGTGSQQLRSA